MILATYLPFDNSKPREKNGWRRGNRQAVGDFRYVEN